jgi:hypothetical protein
MGNVGSTLALMAKPMLGLGEALLKDIKPADFGRQPLSAGGTVIATNHPAFVYGHLSLYSARILEFVGRDPAPIAPTQAYTDLFSHGKECLNDPDGKIYPAMEELIAKFRTSHELALKVIPEIDDAIFAKDLPHEGMRARFPTIGAACGFLLCSHTMLHLGQVSAWRRCMGLGSAM